MGVFSSRKDREVAERLAQSMNDAVKALSDTPYRSAGAYAADPGTRPVDALSSGAQGLLQALGRITDPMPTPPTQFGGALGTGFPFAAAPLDIAYDPATGRALPRLWQEPVAWNLELNYQRLQWDALWAVATQVDLVTRGIGIKIDELVKLQWSFVVEDSTIESIMAEKNVTHSKAAAIARELYQDEIARVTAIWENPYPTQGRTFTEWMTEFLWNHLVCDGVPVYPRYNLGRDCIGFELLDPSTIKVLLNDRGAVPTPPSPAYQQILYSFPRGDYQAAPEADSNYFVGGDPRYLRDQLAYFVRNRRTRSPYGLSVVEQVVSAATLYMERRRWLRGEYSHGVVPDMFFKTDSEKLTGIEPQKLAAYERLFNGQLEGQSQDRRNGKVLPPGMDPIFAPSIDEKFKTDYDNHLIVMVAAIMGVSPSAFGVVPRSGLGGAGERQGEAQAALTMSQKPLENFTAESINTLNRRFLGIDKNITFQWNDSDDNVNSMKDRASAYQIMLSSGQLTINDVRDEEGMPPFAIPEADEPYIITATGPTFLAGLGEVDPETGAFLGNKKAPAPEKGSDDETEEEGESSEGDTTQEGQGEGQPSQVGVKSLGVYDGSNAARAEMQAFRAWARSRKRLLDFEKVGDFKFVYQSDEQAKALNSWAKQKAGLVVVPF